MSERLERRVLMATRDLRSRAKALRQGGEFCGACERGMEGEGEGDAKAMERAADLLELLEAQRSDLYTQWVGLNMRLDAIDPSRQEKAQ